MTWADMVAGLSANSSLSIRMSGGNATEAAVAKIAVLIWIVMGITIAGAFGTVILATPALSNEAAELLPWAALAGFVVAIPASVVIARKILAVSGNR